MTPRKRRTSETPATVVVPDDAVFPSVWASPSFWVSVLPAAAALVGIVFGKTFDITPSVQGLALLAAAIASTGLAVARSMKHKAILATNAQYARLRTEMLLSPDTPKDVKARLVAPVETPQRE